MVDVTKKYKVVTFINRY